MDGIRWLVSQRDLSRFNNLDGVRVEFATSWLGGAGFYVVPQRRGTASCC